MKYALAITGLTLLVVACSPTDPCRSHSDEASCAADKACQWNSAKNKCKTSKDDQAKEENASPKPTPPPPPAPSAPSAAPPSGAPTTTPSPSAPSAPSKQ
jgi:hypothetical protein